MCVCVCERGGGTRFEILRPAAPPQAAQIELAAAPGSKTAGPCRPPRLILCWRPAVLGRQRQHLRHSHRISPGAHTVRTVAGELVARTCHVGKRQVKKVQVKKSRILCKLPNFQLL